MRYALAIFVLSSLFAVVSSASYPSCANTCISNPDTGDCSPTDDVCLCNNQQFIQGTTSCIQSNCSGDDLTQAEQAAQALCAAVGVTLSTSATASATSGSSSSSASATSSTQSSGSTSSGVNSFAYLAAAGVVVLAL